MEGITSGIRTRFQIISDTHGAEFTPETTPLTRADVVIHCGDLTEESKLEEFQATIRLLKSLDADLKLVLAGNHDFTLDVPVFRTKITEAGLQSDMDTVVRTYGDYGEARQLFEDAAGITFLDEGIHRFNLSNGASLTVYASPYTPSASGWGFAYHPENGHDFSIEDSVDVVITHGPPRGISDYTLARQRAGCPKLFEAVARARPQLHCFGHIHEGWGARLVTWRDEPSEVPSHFTDIDNDRSITIAKLSTLKERKNEHQLERCCSTSHCTGDANPIEKETQTLFVNAAIQGIDEQQPPWVVDIELPKVP
ncbi:hypothetical protein PRK78_002032 [Emydomyces testavorans]|uniref:Calcineurin-like phosphoesterase domain-containing protein n=1 Tax=Emydomyces testavorans TaxID=2070801 RepID=A0AAF0DEX7_9EURO|nr:hypothetical protein PRK78_002032 [Emydomyces testavorans]